MKLVNIGSGTTFHKDWINLDLKESKLVRYHDVKKPLPFKTNSIDVIYHSHVLEHLTKEDGRRFTLDCYNVLKKKGIMRVVIPDMEQIVREYLSNLEKGFNENSQITITHYQWNKIELFDQMIRRNSCGEMYEMILEGMIDKEYVIKRNGDEILSLLEMYQKKEENMLKSLGSSSPSNNPQTSGKTHKWMYVKLDLKILLKEAVFKLKSLGSSSPSNNPQTLGEAHKWMYDKLDLKILLEEAGFQSYKIVKYNESQIPNWSEYKLDTSKYGDYPRKPDSLFVEVVKWNSTIHD